MSVSRAARSVRGFSSRAGPAGASICAGCGRRYRDLSGRHDQHSRRRGPVVVGKAERSESSVWTPGAGAGATRRRSASMLRSRQRSRGTVTFGRCDRRAAGTGDRGARRGVGHPRGASRRESAATGRTGSDDRARTRPPGAVTGRSHQPTGDLRHHRDEPTGRPTRRQRRQRRRHQAQRAAAALDERRALSPCRRRARAPGWCGPARVDRHRRPAKWDRPNGSQSARKVPVATRRPLGVEESAGSAGRRRPMEKAGDARRRAPAGTLHTL